MNHKLILAAIVVLAVFLRVYQLGSIPTLLNRDEAALAYNALLLQSSGQDEWGVRWPLTLLSFGDYKLIGYVATLVPLFELFGAHDWVVKLPAVVAGVGLVFVSYFFVSVLEDKKTGLIVALLVAISPWAVFYSRVAFEANLALFFLVGSLAGLWLSIIKSGQWWHYGLIICCWLLALVTYNTPFLLAPFVLFSTMIIFPKFSWSRVGIVLLMLLITIGIGSQLIPLSTQKGSITIFSDATVQHNYIQQRLQLSGLKLTVLGSKPVYYAQLIAQNIINSFSFKFLVTSGGTHPWHSLPGRGHIYLITYLFGLIGLVLGVSQSFQSLRKMLTCHQTDWQLLRLRSWMLIMTIASLLPAVVTVDAPHATRSLLFLWLWLWWAAIGFTFVLDRLKQSGSWAVNVLLVCSLLGLAIEFSLFARAYFWHYPQHQPPELMTGLPATINQLELEHPDQQIAVVDPDGFSYILFAWYLKLNPAVFYQTVVRQQPNQLGFRYGERLDRFHFIGQAIDRTAADQVLVEWKDQQWLVKD